MTNKKIGNNFEAGLCKLFSSYGFWVHNLAQNQAGQPADIIAVKNKKAYLIDCKVCTNTTFSFSRIEENQDLSMTLWKECGNGEGWFALFFPAYGQILMIPHYTMIAVSHEKSSISLKEIDENKYGKLIVDWFKQCK